MWKHACVLMLGRIFSEKLVEETPVYRKYSYSEESLKVKFSEMQNSGMTKNVYTKENISEVQ